jgi:flagellar basal-body rod protein FlgB
MPTKLDNLLGFHASALSLRAQRGELLASNLANADTPNYKARDVDFKTLLADAQAGQQGSGPRLTHARHMSESGTATSPEAMYRIPVQPSVDGNTVDAQREKAEYMQNALQYQATLHFIDGQIKTLRTAIRGD